MNIAKALLFALGGVAILVTALPFVPSTLWAVRIWDFPRTQIAAVLAAVLLALPALAPLRSLSTAGFAGLAAAALGWQVFSILPYTPIAETQARSRTACESDSRLSLLVANVLIDNRDAKPLLALVERLDPDLVLLMETDAWWDREIGELKRKYPQAISRPLENSYGLHLYSRFPLVEPQLRFLVEEDVPSIKTGVALPSGALVNLYGLHPKPPPLQDTAERDAELLIVGKEVRAEAIPSIVAGDLNDVAWSRSNTLFQEISGLLDPRIGRGLYATFNAHWPFLKWPLDHVFFEESFWLLDVAVLDEIGSDHFPLHVALCHDPAAGAVRERPEPEADDLDEAEEAIEQGLEEARE